MYVKIVKCNGNEWYRKCIGQKFKVHSESRKNVRDKYMVKLEKQDRWLIDGYMYAWVDKKHCILLKAIKNKGTQIIFDEFAF